MVNKQKISVQKNFRFYFQEDKKLVRLSRQLEITQVAVVSRALELLEMELAKELERVNQ